MQSSGTRRYTFSISAVAALLTGCGGSQPPIGAPDAMPQAPAIAVNNSAKVQVRHGSWMLPEAIHRTLVYVTTGCASTGSCYQNKQVYAYAYPSGTLEGTLTLSNDPINDCSDNHGNVWVTELVSHDHSYESGQIVKYKHGGVKPIETLSDNNVSTGCAVDPSTGTLAVINDSYNDSSYGGVTIFPGGTGPPKYYMFFVSGSTYALPASCTYDSSGDLFITLRFKLDSYPTQIIWLKKGASRFESFHLHPQIAPREAQWYGTDLTVAVGGGRLVRFKIEGSDSASRVGHTVLADSTGYGEWVIADRKLFSIESYDPVFSVWRYPGGGDPIKTVTGSGVAAFTGITVSTK